MVASTGTEDKTGAPSSIGALAGALIAVLAVRIVALYYNATDLFFDEAQYWSWSLEPDFGYYSKPPLIAWLIRLATETCGSSEFCIRLPSPLLHAMTALAVFAVGPWRDPLRNGWVINCYLATCVGVIPLALICGAIRDIPVFWRLIDCSFGVLGALPLLYCLKVEKQISLAPAQAQP